MAESCNIQELQSNVSRNNGLKVCDKRITRWTLKQAFPCSKSTESSLRKNQKIWQGMAVVMIGLPYHMSESLIPVSNAVLHNGVNRPPLHIYFQLILKPELHGLVDILSRLISGMLFQTFYPIWTDDNMWIACIWCLGWLKGSIGLEVGRSSLWLCWEGVVEKCILRYGASLAVFCYQLWCQSLRRLLGCQCQFTVQAGTWALRAAWRPDVGLSSLLHLWATKEVSWLLSFYHGSVKCASLSCGALGRFSRRTLKPCLCS